MKKLQKVKTITVTHKPGDTAPTRVVHNWPGGQREYMLFPRGASIMDWENLEPDHADTKK